MRHASVRLGPIRTAGYAGIIAVGLIGGDVAAQGSSPLNVLDATSSWVELLAEDLTTCAEHQCASVDDRACASTCDSSRTTPPRCREVDCAACLDVGVGCEGASCVDRVCVLCAWPGEGDDVSQVCHASPSPSGAAPSPLRSVEAERASRSRGNVIEKAALQPSPPLRPSWAIYEVKNHRYRLLTSGVLGGPSRVIRAEPSTNDSSHLRARIRKMGMLELIHSSRDRDDPVAHVFAAGGTLEESLHASFEDTQPRQRNAPLHATLESRPAVHDVRALLFEGTPRLEPQAKRVSTITARVANEHLVDIDGTLDDAGVRRALERSRDAFRLCYETAFKTAPAPSGRVTMEFDVAPSGRVTSASLTEDELQSRALSHCALSTIERLRFPSHESETASFRAVLSFRHRP